MLVKSGMQERGMHAQLVGHEPAGVATSLAWAAAVMCEQWPLEVWLPGAVAQAHSLWDAAARVVDVA